ncbi:MAG TPA: hypothetical protein VIJ57_00740 [Hanamia sp.]
MKRLFLYKVYCYNKKLFLFFAFFAFVTIICNLTGNEITPFYVWGMYSQKEKPPEYYQIYKITVNDKILDYSTGFFPANRFFLQSPLSYYLEMKENGDPLKLFLQKKMGSKYFYVLPYESSVFNSSQNIEKFPGWYKKYLEQTTGQEIKSYKVEVLKAIYDSRNRIDITHSDTLINDGYQK